MSTFTLFRLLVLWVSSFAVFSCSVPEYDYSKFKASNPTSILVLPPINETTEVGAEQAVLSSLIKPLSEAGYYMIPPSLMTETFKRNGYTQPSEIHKLEISKLRKIFAADAVLKVKITQYGQKYLVITSRSDVQLEAKLFDSKTGEEIWSGSAYASSSENSSSNQLGLAGILVEAVVTQVVGDILDASYLTAKTASDRLVNPKLKNTLLHGPKHPSYVR